MSESLRPPHPEKIPPSLREPLKKTGEKISEVRRNIFGSLEQHPEYTPHRLDNPKVQIQRLPHLGRAVFAREKIAAGEIIAAFAGSIHQAKKISELPNDPPDFMRDHVIQIGEETYLHGKGGLAELVNHSCDPNCGIEGSSYIVARKEIQAGEQLTWDYAMTEDSDWSFEGCLCGSESCRGTIGPYRELPPEKKQEYWQHTAAWLKKKYPQEGKENPSYTVQTLLSESGEITDEVLWEVTWFFWWLFANDFAGQFLFYPSEKKPISAQQAFGVSDGSYVPFEKLLTYSPAEYPVHPTTGEQAIYWVHPQAAFQKFQQKFSQQGILTLLRDEAGQIIGLTFGRKCSLRDAFSQEEWENPVAYSGHAVSEKRDFKRFMDSINQTLNHHPHLTEGSERPQQLSAESEVYVWNCIGISKNAHGKGHFWKLTSEFFKHIPEKDRKSLWNIAEAVVGNTAYKLFKRARTIDVPEALGEEKPPQENESTMIITPLEDFVTTFTRQSS
ncbi:MAG: SET domain-containing protein [Candidatus Altimarinota bacterium]